MYEPTSRTSRTPTTINPVTPSTRFARPKPRPFFARASARTRSTSMTMRLLRPCDISPPRPPRPSVLRSPFGLLHATAQRAFRETHAHGLARLHTARGAQHTAALVRRQGVAAPEHCQRRHRAERSDRPPQTTACITTPPTRRRLQRRAAHRQTHARARG